MKRRMRKVTALVLSVGMMLSMTITSGAVTIDEAQKKQMSCNHRRVQLRLKKIHLLRNLIP